ncbi:MAG: ATP-dependent RNA helicase RhlB [Candidatus Thiodiazotropha sp. (ex Lucinoma annulata)]|nr:ATP-dependent RNA helicase RhlB [Candidatus Thiodiazotropha sp. (ex Lucinoma borealis)]MCU7838735.1 ATP-dependent RNA helicase RhlB [Candidatus Thiodiazotropha sp. (ex Troendleina suluensis)]MCU7863621.1 ATP-dependent RNA helicase RhlB [Candidatus Thiodiazotropha sp. (ex Lucinoma borealis)]MCU7870919.1 ATP-dependent RNA helicase RhlB [Candidatus Thiodiazotropha sp. (ex Lucinoma borealis)]MCU7885810.1 ATP-dependent RNA helicase RhlB [Candidatus Thiodiazotropha sp. (ex Lucinoma annulata)]
MSDKHLTDTRFSDFDLPEQLLLGIQAAGFEYCTPIQAETLPIALAGKDLAGQAQTGTGKTAAFLIAVLHYLIKNPASEKRRPNQPRTLIVAPTRELAVQIYNDAQALTKHTEFTTAAVFGGTGYDKQRKQLEEGVDILIGTPGRLIDYLKQHVYDLREIQVIVLDEADRMFDLGFIKDIRFMLRRCPPPEKRLGMLFSATLSYRVKELAYEHMNNPHSIEVEPERVTADKITETCYMTANEEKIPLLIGLLKEMENTRSIVFVNTKRVADKVWGFLQGNGIDTAVLSGDVPQNKRLSLLKGFQNGELPVLVATDVAARGLHIPDVTHVFNYDLPEDAEDYVHRVGRTARAGASGEAISFACETYAFSMPDIEKYVGHSIAAQTVSSELLAEIDPKSRIYPEKGSRQPHRSKDGHKSHGKGHHHKGHRSKGEDNPNRRRRRHGPKPPQSSSE